MGEKRIESIEKKQDVEEQVVLEQEAFFEETEVLRTNSTAPIREFLSRYRNESSGREQGKRQILVVLMEECCQSIVLPKDSRQIQIPLHFASGRVEVVNCEHRIDGWHFSRRENAKIRRICGDAASLDYIGARGYWECKWSHREKVALLGRDVNEHDLQGVEYKISCGSKISIGRNIENDIVYDTCSGVSGVHLILEREAKGWLLEPKGRNGVYVNGRIIEGRQATKLGDIVDVLGVEIHIEEDKLKIYGLAEKNMKQKEVVGQYETMLSLFCTLQLEKDWRDTLLLGWSKNQVRKEIKAAVGMTGTKEVVWLDLHEQADGPHGMVLGMTGAGKSVFLQTLVLSLAARYAPWSLQFVLVDYKGGDMALPLQELPHVVGCWTNIEGSKEEKFIHAINREIDKREKCLANQACYHVDSYNEQVEERERFAHLCIIIDEYAQLQVERPRVQDCLEKISRVGRSLGIHLLLGSQNLRGEPMQNMVANSNFFVCFRTQLQQEMTPLQEISENTQYFPCGRAMLLSAKKQKCQQMQVAYSLAIPWGRKEYAKGKSEGRLLEDALIDCAQKYGYKTRKMWMNDLPTRINCGQRKDLEGRIVIGQVDDICLGEQPYYVLRPQDFDQLVVLGDPKSGKSSLAKTLVLQLCRWLSPKQHWIYVCDTADGPLSTLGQYPQVGGVASDENTIGRMVYFLMKELETRIEEGNESKTAIWVVIDDFARIRQLTEDKYLEFFYRLWRDGKKFGIYMVLVGAGVEARDIPKLWRNYASGWICLSERKELLEQAFPGKTIPPATKHGKGRGYALIRGRVMEFQGWLDVDFDVTRTWRGEERAQKLAVLPKQYNIQHLRAQEHLLREDKLLALCNREKDGSLVCMGRELETSFLVGASRKKDMEPFFRVLIRQLRAKKIPFLVLGSPKGEGREDACHYVENAQGFLKSIEEESCPKGAILLVYDVENWAQSQVGMVECMLERHQQQVILFCENRQARLARKNKVFRDILSQGKGFYLGDDLEEQFFFSTKISGKEVDTYDFSFGDGVLFTECEQSWVRIPRLFEEEQL